MAPRTRRVRSRPAVTVVVALAVLAAGCSSPLGERVDSTDDTGPASASRPLGDDELATSSPPPGPADDPSPPDAPADPVPTTPATTPPTATPTSEGAEESTGGYGVSAGHPAAVDAGMAVLDDGGGAVDAAVAAALTMGVAEPFTSGLGGGGAAIVVGPGEDPVYYEFREVVAQSGVIPPSDTGVPGQLAGLGRLHEEHGSVPWDALVRPAERLAEDGVEVSGFLAEELAGPTGSAAVAGLDQFADDDGVMLGEGDLLVQEDLADTLAVIGDEGPQSLYTGSLTPLLTQVEGLDEESLAAYEVRVGSPARGVVGDHVVLSAGPPLVGAALVQQLQLTEAMGIADTEPGSADALDLTAQAWTVAEESVTSVLGDPAFVDVPLAQLTDAGRNADLAADLPGLGAGERPVAQAVPPEHASTAQVTVVGPDGTVVSMTTTVLSFWGSGESVGGFFLNDTLRRFDLGEGDANAPEAGRRTVSWMSPTVVLDGQGRPVLVLGTPGGRLIPGVLHAVLTRVLLQGQGLEEAVLAPRSQLNAGVVETEGLDASVVAELNRRGYGVADRSADPRYFGSVQALQVDPATGEVTGVRDPRREGTFAVAEPAAR